jgi:hypothetical protein
MLDVHAPHGPTHSWQDFLGHIAAIAIGLLLALALEKLVEYVHERHQLTEARRELAMGGSGEPAHLSDECYRGF